MEIVYIIIALVGLLAVYFLFGKKEPPEALPPTKGRDALPPKDKEVGRAPPKKPKAADKAADAEADKDEAVPAPDAQPPSEPEPDQAPTEPKTVFGEHADVQTLRSGLSRSRDESGFFGKLKALFSGKAELSPEIVDEIEEILLSSDVGTKTTGVVLERVRDALTGADRTDSAKVWEALREEAVRILDVDGKAGAFKLQAKPTVVLMVGVNGAGKTTTIGKLATRLGTEGQKCILAAGDTFRAAAVQQLVAWGQRVGCTVVRGKDGADPASVIFEAIQKGKEEGADVVLADTAGRLHTKTNLMVEMQKIARSAGKALDGAPHEVLLVIDATNGQNALAQAQEFKEALELTGIVLTKLDGTAKGGVILGISDALSLPVRFIGLGERSSDLHEFAPKEFVEALLGKDSEADAA